MKNSHNNNKIPNHTAPYFKDGIFFAQGEKILLRRDGIWLSDGVEITHEETKKLFFRSIFFDQKIGCYYLQVGKERMYIEVEETAYFVTDLLTIKNGIQSKIQAQISNGKSVELSSENTIYCEAIVDEKKYCSLYLKVDQNEYARFFSGPYYELLSSASFDERTNRCFLPYNMGEIKLELVK